MKVNKSSHTSPRSPKSTTKQNPNNPYTTPDRPPNIDGPEKAY